MNVFGNTGFHIIRFSFLFLLFALFLPETVHCQVTHQEAFDSLKPNRDRLLASYAAENGYMDAVSAWNSMSTSQKGVFLTITDLLGRRTIMTGQAPPPYDYTYVGDGDDQGFGCSQMNETTSCNDGCYIYPQNYYGPSCFYVSGPTCVDNGKCFATESGPPPPRNYDVALSHVTKIYAILGGGSSCGGSSNRIFLEADFSLIYNLRNDTLINLDPWEESTDLAGPHEPFSQSSQTDGGQPRGQTHQFEHDYEATSINHPLFYFSGSNPYIVEIDIDYNLTHDSNPECYYGGVYGRTKYENHWFNRGIGGSAEFNYSPDN